VSTITSDFDLKHELLIFRVFGNWFLVRKKSWIVWSLELVSVW
jgi:hypothetical protein